MKTYNNNINSFNFDGGDKKAVNNLGFNAYEFLNDISKCNFDEALLKSRYLRSIRRL